MITTIWTGLSVGCLYTLVALGFQIPITQTGIFNFAHAITVVAGTYAVYTFCVTLGLPILVGTLASALLMAIMGALVELIAIEPLREAQGHASLITTVGASVIIEGVILVVYGYNPRGLSVPGNSHLLVWFGGRLELLDVVLIAAAVVATVAVSMVCRRTQWGIACEAATSDPNAAVVRGVNIRRLRMTAFAFAGALAGLMSPLTAANVGVDHAGQPTLLIFGFVALAVGGTGSYVGCLIGGILIGLVQATSDRYVGSNYSALIIFGILLLVLLAKPTGILGTRNLRTL